MGEIKKLGIMGGSFNPIHKGHMNAARGFLERLKLDKLLIIPVNTPPHKSAREMESAENRLNMCRIAADGEENIEVSDIEIRRSGLSYTVDTLKELKKLYPLAELYLLTGTDMFVTLNQWRYFPKISELAVLCACAREDGEYRKLLAAKEKLEREYKSHCIVENIPVEEVSSTEVRDKLENGEDVSDLLDKGVIDYIKKHGLYRH